MRARSAMAARVGASRGDGGGAVDEWAIWRLRLRDHRDRSGIGSLHGRAESMSRSTVFKEAGAREQGQSVYRFL